MPGQLVSRLSSSMRTRSAEESLAIVAPFARERGVSRVVDTTWLDNVGIPVYASIRPDGQDGTLWVHAGKGFTHAEAKIGAYMEAIEFSYAEPGHSEIDWFMSTPREILQSFNGGIGLADFCAHIGRTAVLDGPISAVWGEEISCGLGRVQLPAELLYVPFRPQGQSLYGTHTNGLASGNTVQEASVHALTEVMERHVHSFELLDDKSCFVKLDHLTPKLQEMVRKIEAAGLNAVLRYSENEFGMAFFSAYVFESEGATPLTMANGAGFHPVREIAAIRALSEAVQSRLTFIHGGREDIIEQYAYFDKLEASTQLKTVAGLRQSISDPAKSIQWDEIPDFEPVLPSLEDVWELLLVTLRSVDMPYVVRLTLTKTTDPFQVVKVVVPGAEVFSFDCPRVGPRLLKYFSK